MLSTECNSIIHINLRSPSKKRAFGRISVYNTIYLQISTNAPVNRVGIEAHVTIELITTPARVPTATVAPTANWVSLNVVY